MEASHPVSQPRPEAAAPDPGQERVLLRRSAAGDTRAFDPIVAAYTTRAYHYACSILHSHHDALDAAQDAFVKAYRALAKFDTDRPFYPWFLRILRNQCLDHLASSTRRPERPGVEDPAEAMRELPSHGRGPEAGVIGHEDAARVHAILKKLTPEHSESLHLRYFEDMSYEEIADVLGIPVGTVMSRLFHARRNFAKLLQSG